MKQSITTLVFWVITIPLLAQIPCNGAFLPTGDAVDLGGCIQLTSNSTGQQGCAWLNSPVDFSMPFTHTMTANFGFSDAGADGICLIYQTNGPGTCGISGGGIGALGIPNSFIVEFDTWNNAPLYDDIPNDHCAVDINGDFSTSLNGPVDLGNIEDGADHTITFSWDPGSMSYNIAFDGTPILGGTFDIINNCFGGNTQAYWGYSASTGAATNTQTICPVVPPPIVLDAGIDVNVPCSDGVFTLNGSVSPFNPNYLYEWTTPDGMIVSGAFSLNPQVSGPGTYILTLTDLNGGCMEMDQVVIGIDPIIANIAPPPFFPCDGSPIFLNGSNSSFGPFISYQWTTSNGLILSGANTPNPMIGAPGFYNLTVVYNDGSGLICTENQTVQVLEDTNIPFATGLDATINCDPGFVVLSGLGSSTGPSIAYTWSTLDGLIVSDGNTLFPTIAAPGVYTLLVTNVSNGCFDEFDVVVNGNLDPPIANATVNGSLDCQTATLTLDGSGSSQGANFTYEWLTLDGNIVSGGATSSPVVDQAGTYTIVVTNTDNGCTEFADVTVQSTGVIPFIDIQIPDSIYCDVNSLTLNASGSDQGPDLSYTWTTNDGVIDADPNSLTPTVSGPGFYYLTVENAGNGCTAMDSVEVGINTELPAVDAGNPQILSCNATSIDINGTATAYESLTFFWTTPNGNIISDPTLEDIQADAAGTYFLEATNSQNGCSAIDSVIIGLDNDVPAISLIGETTLNCDVSQITIDASASDQGSDFTFSWSSSDGNFVSGQNTLQVVIDEAGTYNLQITNTTNDCTNDMDMVITQDTINPDIDILLPDTLDCTIDQIMIDASNSSQGNQFTYEWTSSDGNLVSGDDSLTPQIDAPGNYVLSILNTENNCSSESSIQVEQDTIAPTVAIEEPAVLNCDQTSFNLDANNSSSGADFSINWNTSNGNITGGGNGLTPTIDAPGDYQLEIENTINGCASSAQVTVTEDIMPPTVNAGQDMIINCDFPSIQLDGSGSSSGTSYMITWTDAGNNIVDNSSLTPIINASGEYVLEIVNSDNGCIETDTVLVDEDFETPISTIALPANLTCSDSLVQLDGSASSMGANIAYQWTTPNGNIFSGINLPNAEASQAGQYFLTVENINNGCTATDSTLVMQDANFPVANIDPVNMLNCNTQSITLQGVAIANTNNLGFEWSTSNGNFLSGNNTLAPTVDQPGSYTLEVTDLDNNCQAMASIEVLQDTLVPTVDAGINDILNCFAPTLLLDGTASDQGTQFSYNWTTTNGNILSDDDSLTPEIDAEGDYTLVINNLDNGCVDSAMVSITEDFETPDLSIAIPDTLNCTLTSTQIISNTSLEPAVTQFAWTTPDGNIQNGEQGPTPAVDAPGTYLLTIQNSVNGCQTTDSVTVIQDVVEPIIQIAEPAILNCELTSQEISAQGSDNGALFQIEWTTDDGNIISGVNGLTPEINEPGTYELNILNTENNCSSNDFVIVDQDTVAPTVSVASPSILNCNTTQINLNANGSSSGSNFIIDWSSTNGNIQGGQNGLTPLVNAPGAYQMNIQNIQNGCTDSISVTVDQDITLPAITLATPIVLDCNNQDQSLDASSSSSGPLFVYNWTTNDGMIVSGADGAMPIINEPGTYTLNILNLQNGCDSSQSLLVTQDITTPDIQIAEPAILNCEILNTNLDASGSSSGPEFSYEWMTDDGNIVGPFNIPNPTVDLPGEYSLQIINTTNGCDTNTTVLVNQDITLPSLSIEPPTTLTCQLTSITIDASASSAGGNFQIDWTNADGNTPSNPNSLTPAVEIPGTYTLTIQNTINQCVDSLSVEVQQDVVQPDIEIAAPELLTCSTVEQLLNASNSSSGSNFEYSWTTNDGQITSDPDTPMPVINEPGTYQLMILNTQNGCDSSQSILVQQDVEIPELSILSPEQLNCNVGSTILDASNSSTGAIFDYEWTTPNGNISSGENTTNPLIDEPGTYNLLITNTFNGCDTMASVIVTEDTNGPILEIQMPEILNCIVENVELDATNSSSGNAFQITWSTNDGNIIDGQNTLLPSVDAPGTYTLNILNLDNLCVDSLDIVVLQDIVPPVAEAGNDFILPCFEESSLLDGSGSSSGGPYSYLWNTGNGNILSGTQTLNPEISAPGTYSLLVTNTQNGCESTDQITVTQTIPEAEVSIIPPLCHDDPATILIENVNMGIPPYVYSIDEGANFFSEPIFSNLDAGNYDVVVQDVNGCQYDDFIEIQQPDSLVIIATEPEISIRLGNEVQLFTQTNIPESDIASIIWEHDGSLDCDTCLHPIAKPLQTTDYLVKIESINGCTDQALVKVFVDKRVDVYIPNAFSPGDSDGFNDRFYIFARQESIREVKSFQVFSRWGETMFEVYGFQPNDPTYGWNGLFRGREMNAGVYVYMAEIEMIDGSVVLFKGDVTLIR